MDENEQPAVPLSEPLPLDNATIIVIWVLSMAVVVGFALFALIMSWRQSKKPQAGDSVEFFLTARNTQPTLRVAWSFVAGSLGAWVLAGPAGYAVTAGVIGMIFYALASGLPIAILALIGDKVQRKLPSVLSFCDYIYYRFGLLPQIYVVLIMLLNMGIGMTAEYTAIGDIFEKVIGISRIPIVVVVGVLTMAYTAYGGLYVSILTDQFQAIFGSTLLVILVIYVAATFKTELGPLPDFLLPNDTGYSAIAAMPISLFCATIYSEGPWQRVWASEDPKALKRGALLASVIIVIFVFVFGFFGFLSAWAGNPTDDQNVLIFKLLAQGQEVAPSWVIVLVVLLAVTMNESAIDTLQNALVDTISTMVLRNKPVMWSRLAVIVVNVPIVIVSLQNYPVINLFLIGNMVTSTSALPMLLGLWDGGSYWVTGPAVLFGCIFSLFSVMVYGYLIKGDFGVGLSFVFFESYDYPSFLIATGFSLLGVGLWVATSYILTKLGLPIPEYLPGFKPGKLEATADPDYDNKTTTVISQPLNSNETNHSY